MLGWDGKEVWVGEKHGGLCEEFLEGIRLSSRETCLWFGFLEVLDAHYSIRTVKARTLPHACNAGHKQSCTGEQQQQSRGLQEDGKAGPQGAGGCPGACKKSALSLAADCGSGGHQIENIDARKASGG